MNDGRACFQNIDAAQFAIVERFMIQVCNWQLAIGAVLEKCRLACKGGWAIIARFANNIHKPKDTQTWQPNPPKRTPA